MVRLDEDITRDLGEVVDQWSTSHSQTKAELVNLREYYSNIEGKSKNEVIKKATEDRARLENNVKEHKKIAGTAQNTARDLRTQVGSSEDGVENMKKYGKPAAFGFTLLGAIIGLALGLKVPGLGQAVAVVVAVVIGIVFFGSFAIMLYFFMRRRAQNRARLWKRAEHDNQRGLELEALVVPKRTRLNDISGKLADIKEETFIWSIEKLLQAITKYLDEN